MKDWIKRHESTVVTVGSAIGLWIAVTTSFHRDIDRLDARMDRLDARMDRLEQRMDGIESHIYALETRIAAVENRLTAVETILMMQGYPLKTALKEEK